MRVEHNLTQGKNVAKRDALVPHPYVSPADEALLVSIYENFQPKWSFELEHKAVLSDKDHPDYKATKKQWEDLDKKYTEAKGGQVPFVDPSLIYFWRKQRVLRHSTGSPTTARD